MKLAAISDLHAPESGIDLAQVSRQARAGGADALVVVGDAVNQFRPEALAQVLAALVDAAPVRVFVPGNHELWSANLSTAAIYERHLPALCERHGWRYLDAGPVVVGGVAIAGNIGWYDYSLTERESFAQARVAVGAEIIKAVRRKQPHSLPLHAVTEEQLAHKALVVLPPADGPWASRGPALVRWNDRRWVRLGVPDGVFAADCAARLREHLRQASNAAERVVAAVHTVPFREVLGPSVHPVDSLTRAYHGSAALGAVIGEFPKVKLVVHGHRHRPGAHDVGGLPVLNVTGKPGKGGGLVLREV